MPLGPAYGGGFAGVSNPGNIVYVKGDERTEDSLRLVPDVLGENIEMQRRLNGVWNDTGIQIAASTIHLGRDLRISGAGQFIRTFDVIDNASALIPHVLFDDTGTVIDPHMPVLSPQVTRFVVQPDFSSEVTGTELTVVFTSPIRAVRSRLYFRTGSIGATAPVQFTIRRGSSTGPIIFQRNLPTSLMATPDTEFQVDLEGLIQQNVGDQIHSAFVSENLLSLAGNSSGVFFVALDFCFLTTEDIVTDTFVVGNDLSLALSNSLQFAKPNAVFS